MTTKLTIQNFKRIREKIELKEFSKVNYLVGKNGSGKTSVLSSLSFLGDKRDGSNSRHYFTKESIVEFQCDFEDKQDKNALFWDENDPNKVSLIQNFKIQLIFDGASVGMGANDVHQVNFDQNNLFRESLEFLNETLLSINAGKISAKRVINNDDPWDTSVGSRIFLENDVEINPNLLAQGYQSITKLKWLLHQTLELTSRLDNVIFIVLIEEPENNLHPSLQKIIPTLIDNLIRSLNENAQSAIHFFVSTHSPFVIGAAAKYHDQKVYMLQDGKPIDNEGNQQLSTLGYRGRECAWVVGQMLGAEVTDLGYPENYCIIEEYSLQVILEHGVKNGWLRNFQFVSAGGESNVIKINDRIDNLLKLNTLIKCNPYYSDKYLIIVDSFQDFGQKQRDRFTLIREKLSARFVELTKLSLEDYYQNLDMTLYNSFKKDFAEAGDDRIEQGIVKSNYAKNTVKLLESSQDLSLLFGGELDLLFNP